MTDDIALYRFGLFFIGMFTMVIILSNAFKESSFFRDIKLTDWLTAGFTAALAVVTWTLANIASKQTEILSHTDRALHLAAAAQSASAQTAEKLRLFTEATNRAWVGPVSAHSDPFSEGNPIKIVITFNNTGRLLSSYKAEFFGRFYTREEWIGGKVAPIVTQIKDNCMKGMPHANPALILRGVAYPTTGFSSYTLTYDSAGPNGPQDERIFLTKTDLDTDHLFVLAGCFVYKTGESSSHHSFFCYFREPGIPHDVNSLFYCPFGQQAD
jgi:hypothetical protein